MNTNTEQVTLEALRRWTDGPKYLLVTSPIRNVRGFMAKYPQVNIMLGTKENFQEFLETLPIVSSIFVFHDSGLSELSEQFAHHFHIISFRN